MTAPAVVGDEPHPGNTSRLLGLPAELRIIVWIHVFDDSNATITYMPGNLYKSPTLQLHKDFGSRRKGRHPHPLFHVCRQTYNDIRYMFYDRTQFKLGRDIIKHYKQLPSALALRIRHLELQVNELDLLDIVYPLLDEVRTSTRNAIEIRSLPNLANLKLNLVTVRQTGTIKHEMMMNHLVRFVYFSKPFHFEFGIKSHDLWSPPVILTAKIKGEDLLFTYQDGQPQQLWEEVLRLSLCLPTPSSPDWIDTALPEGQKNILRELVTRNLRGVNSRMYTPTAVRLLRKEDLEVIEGRGIIDESMRGRFAEAWRAFSFY